MSNIQAAIGCGQMERIDELIAGKRRVFQYYEKHLSHLPVTMNPEPAGTTNGYWMPSIVVDRRIPFNRDELLAAFRKDDIDGRVFFWPLTLLPIFGRSSTTPVSYDLYGRSANLPSYHDLTVNDMQRIVAHIEHFLSA